MKVAVVGSGIWGACSAYQLKKAGVDVELYDMWELVIHDLFRRCLKNNKVSIW